LLGEKGYIVVVVVVVHIGPYRPPAGR